MQLKHNTARDACLLGSAVRNVPEAMTDMTNLRVIPYLIHFSRLGIVPEILDVSHHYFKIVKAEGPRLSQFINKHSEEEVSQVYRRMGSNIAYIEKLGVCHADLHCDNVIVQDGKPLIIDWEDAQLVGREFPSEVPMFYGGDANHFLGSYNVSARPRMLFISAYREEMKRPVPSLDEITNFIPLLRAAGA